MIKIHLMDGSHIVVGRVNSATREALEISSGSVHHVSVLGGSTELMLPVTVNAAMVMFIEGKPV